MNKSILFVALMVLPGFLLRQPLKTPDYSRTCSYVPEHLTDTAKKKLQDFLGKETLIDISRKITAAARNTIYAYTKALFTLHLSGPYKMSQLDSALRPLNLNLLDGIARYEKILKNDHLPKKERLFALQVLIGLHTAMQLPMQGITGIEKREDFIRHDVFLQPERADYRNSPTTFRLYDAYLLGLRVAQAGGNERMVQSFMERGYENAGRYLGGSLRDVFDPEWLKHTGEGSGKIAEPGQEPIYLMRTARFTGGGLYFDKFLNEHLQYPKDEWEKGIEGSVFVEMVVEKDGSLTHLKVVKHLTPDIDSEVVRVIRLSPKWEPGHQDNLLNKPAIRSQQLCIANFRILPGKTREDAFDIPFRDNTKPEFIGGKTAFLKYIRENSTYKFTDTGRVTVRYLIDKNGKVISTALERSLSPETDAEALKLLRQSPKWQPGRNSAGRITAIGDTVSIEFPIH